MPRRKSKDKIRCTMYNNQRSIKADSYTLHIMKDMDVVPLEDVIIDSVSPRPLNHKQVTIYGKRKYFTSERSPNKIRKHNFISEKYGLFEVQGEDNFSRLSDEIILHIFQWLPKTDLVKCSAVCKRWKHISYDESLWKQYDIGGKSLKSGVLSTLLHRGVSILRLAKSEIHSPVFTDVEFSNRLKFSKLQYLDLTMATLSQDALANLLSVCNTLKKLSLEHCPLNEQCCRYIAQNKDLTVLNTAMCEGFTPNGLYEITSKCIKLKEWNLAWTSLDRECMSAFLPHLPGSLTRLNISGHREFLDDTALIIIVKRCPNLIELDVSDSPLLTDVSFGELVERCKNLEHLHTSRCYNIPTACNRLLKHMKNFKKLEIFFTLTDKALADLREYMPEIKINQNLFSTIARPTTGMRRTSIWGLRSRD